MATKYVSSLTGSEMDSALLDMAYHNSEAYAVGTRNGVEVGSSDVTYHNNAKYYASQTGADVQAAEAAAARAEAAVPSGTAGAVFFDRAQTLTSAQQAQARANIAAGGSNRNLLDNPWFTVNQRGYTNNSASSDFVADRWFLYGAPDLTVTNSGNGLVLTGSGQARLRSHYNEKIFMALYGQTLTFSIKINGKVYSVTGTVPSSYPSAQTAFIDSYLNTDVGRIEFVAIWQISTNIVLVYFRVYQAMTIQAVKLEHGSVSTLANDAPPDYGEELTKCMRYFQRLSGYLAYIGSGYCDDTSNAYFICPLSVPLRSGATVSLSYSGVYLNSNSIQAVTGLTVLRNPTSYTTGSIALKATASGLTAKAPALLQIRAENGYIDLSADL